MSSIIRGIVIIESTVDTKTQLEAKISLAWNLPARIAVKVAAGIAVRTIAVPKTSPLTPIDFKTNSVTIGIIINLTNEA